MSEGPPNSTIQGVPRPYKASLQANGPLLNSTANGKGFKGAILSTRGASTSSFFRAVVQGRLLDDVEASVRMCRAQLEWPACSATLAAVWPSLSSASQEAPFSISNSRALASTPRFAATWSGVRCCLSAKVAEAPKASNNRKQSNAFFGRDQYHSQQTIKGVIPFPSGKSTRPRCTDGGASSRAMRKARMATWPYRQQRCTAVPPSLPRCVGSPPLSRSNTAQLLRPCRQAHCRAFSSKTPPTALQSAPLSKRSLTTLSRPLIAAHCNNEQPSSSLASGVSLPSSRNAAISSARPYCAAARASLMMEPSPATISPATAGVVSGSSAIAARLYCIFLVLGWMGFLLRRAWRYRFLAADRCCVIAVGCSAGTGYANSARLCP
mmetsp:Transcript_2286/g.6361  ORF Transcript_2286/g.6361 Transcript_2286/m.6361 type:complete len:380 (-) Transcript_2286:26-1165(-)